ncbi:MAG: hypothetical protein WBC05_07230 [Sedimentisphaerales bacterium]
MMSVKKELKIKYLKVIVAVLVIVFVILLMSVLECDMATPAY